MPEARAIVRAAPSIGCHNIFRAAESSGGLTRPNLYQRDRSLFLRRISYLAESHYTGAGDATALAEAASMFRPESRLVA